VSREITNSPSVILAALGTLRTQFDTWLTEETALLNWVRKDSLTEKIEDANHWMDRGLSALNAQVHVQEYSPTLTVAEAAHRVHIMLKNYGDLHSKPYEYQWKGVEVILGQLTGSGPYAADANTLVLAPFLNELLSAVTLFKQLLAQRDAKSLQKPDKTFREIRKGIEGVYHQITEIIDANAVVNTSAAFANFINHLNPEIERLNAEFHRVRHDIKDCQPEPLPPQIYTGRPLTPTPKVLYVTLHDGTVQLELGKDYNVTYNKNTEVGIAECTVHGKGLYKGSRTVTFPIVHAT
jgi:hypothetical protein